MAWEQLNIERICQKLEPLTADDEVVGSGDIIGGSPLTNALDLLTKKACFLPYRGF